MLGAFLNLGRPLAMQALKNPNVLGTLLVGAVGAQQADEIQNQLSTGNISLDDVYDTIVNFTASPVIGAINEMQTTPAGQVFAPKESDIEAERKFNEELNKRVTFPTEEKKVTVDDVGFTEVQQDFEPLITLPPEFKLEQEGFTPAPEVKPSDYIMKSEEKKEDLKPNEKIFNQIAGVKNQNVERDPNDLFMEGWEKMVIAQPKQIGSLGDYAVAIDPMKRSDNNFLLVKDGKVHATLELATTMGQDKVLDLDAIGVPVEMQGQGIAKDVLNELFKLADENGVTIQGVADPFGSKTLNKKQLLNFYKSMGFKTRGDEITRKPIIKEETEVIPTSEQSFSNLVDTIEEPTQEILGEGIVFPKEKTDNNIRLHTDRLKKLEEGKITTYPGGPQNDRIVLEAPAGTTLPDIAIGNLLLMTGEKKLKTICQKKIL